MKEADMMKETRRWPLALIVIAAVVIASAVIIYFYRDAPGRITTHSVTDGEGGVIVAWYDDNGIYAQRVDASGRKRWQSGGVLIVKCPAGGMFDLQSDAAGGAIVTWEDRSDIVDDRDDPAYYDAIPVYAQRISSDGTFLWGNGIPAGSTGRYSHGYPQVVPDETGGAIYAWNDYKTYIKGLHDDFLRVQRIAPGGSRAWGDEGILVAASSPFRPITEEEIAGGIKGTVHRSWPTYKGQHTAVADGDGGVIVLWEEELDASNDAVYAMRINGDGNQSWPERVMIDSGQGCHIRSAVSDGNGGSIVAIASNIPEATYLRRLGGDGELSWSETGTAIPSQYAPEMIEDEMGGIILFWTRAERPSEPPDEVRYSLTVQNLNPEGELLWQKNPVLTTPEGQYFSADMTADGNGGAILAWRLYGKDYAAYGDILALKLDAGGVTSWQTDGKAVLSNPELKYKGTPQLLDDGSGGAIIVAAAGRGALSGDMVYAQRLDADGDRLWGGGIRLDR